MHRKDLLQEAKPGYTWISRISIVIALYVFSQRQLSPVNIVSAGLCLLVCVSGVRAVREQGESGGTTSSTKYWAGMLVRWNNWRDIKTVLWLVGSLCC